jgi:hypothetical protein
MGEKDTAKKAITLIYNDFFLILSQTPPKFSVCAFKTKDLLQNASHVAPIDLELLYASVEDCERHQTHFTICWGLSSLFPCRLSSLGLRPTPQFP